MVEMNDELLKNRGTLKHLQDTIVRMKKDEYTDFNATVYLLEEAVVRISRLEKGLDYVLTHFEYDLDMEVSSENELKWAKSLLEPVDDNNNSS